MAAIDTNKPVVHGWHVPTYLVHVALSQNVLRFPDLIPVTAVPTKSISTRTRLVPTPIRGSLSSPASTVMSPQAPQIINQKLTYQLQNVQQCKRVLPVAIRFFSLLTTFCGTVMNCICCSSIHTKLVPTGTVFAMILGIPTGHLGLILTA